MVISRPNWAVRSVSGFAPVSDRAADIASGWTGSRQEGTSRPYPAAPLAVLLRFQVLVPIAKGGDNDGRQMVDQGA
jgi:hypothetical protein